MTGGPDDLDPFADLAFGWEDINPLDRPLYAWAIERLGVEPGHRVVDVGCGSGRAIPDVVRAAGPTGEVVGLEPSPAMRREATRLGRDQMARIVDARAEAMPLPDAWADRVMAFALLPHLADPRAAVREFARVLRPGGRLMVFHPCSRAFLAEVHARMDTDEMVIAPGNLVPLLEGVGFDVELVNDGDDRFAVTATRRACAPSG